MKLQILTFLSNFYSSPQYYYINSYVNCCVLLFFVFLGPAPTAYGGSQARGPVRATAASLHTATATLDP